MNFDSVARRIRVACGIAGLAMVVFAGAASMTIHGLAQFTELQNATREKLLALERLDSRLNRTRVTLRQYLLTGETGDLELFYVRSYHETEALEALDGSPRLPEQERLEHLMKQRRQLQYEIVGYAAGGDQAKAVKLLNSPTADDLEDRLDSVLKAARHRERQVLWSDTARPATAWAQYAVIGGLVLVLALFAWILWIVRRYEGERQRVGALLNQSEAMGRALTANMAEGLVTMSEELEVLGMNAAALKVLGYEREDEVAGRHIGELTTRYPGRVAFRELLAERLAQPDPFQIAGVDMTVVRKDGTRLPIQVSLNDVVVGGRRLVTALFRDMSRIREATEAARASERHLREITDTLPVIIAELDTELRFRFVNRAFAEFLAIPQDHALGRTALEVIGEELYAVHAPHLDKALAGSFVHYEVTVTNAAGTTGTYDMHLIPRHDPAGKLVGCYAFATDITVLKRIDSMKTEFISTVSHELRTPLTSIRGSLGLMSGGVLGQLPENAKNLIGIAQNNCDRLIRLINDILDSEKIESGKVPLRMQSVDMAAVARQALAANESFAQQHDVSLWMHTPGSPLMVRADVDRLLQVLTNLLSNAVKFSPKHSSVEVRLSAPAGRVRVEVSDHGPGIPPEFQRRIFQKFSQADSSDTRAKGGTGLGLNISRTLVEKMGGQIGFNSTPGAGATFFFELPRRDAPAAEVPPVPRAPALSGPRKRLILHVEGDGDMRAVVSSLVEECATCVSAGSLQDARDRLRESRFDLVLLEPELDDGPGWELLEDLEALEPSPPVVVFSAAQDEPPPGRQVEAVLVKAQTSEAALVHALRTAMAGVFTLPSPLEA